MPKRLSPPQQRPRVPARFSPETTGRAEGPTYWRWRPSPAGWMSVLAAGLWTLVVLAVSLALLVSVFHPSGVVLAGSSFVIAVFVFVGAFRRMR